MNKNQANNSMLIDSPEFLFRFFFSVFYCLIRHYLFFFHFLRFFYHFCRISFERNNYKCIHMFSLMRLFSKKKNNNLNPNKKIVRNLWKWKQKWTVANVIVHHEHLSRICTWSFNLISIFILFALHTQIEIEDSYISLFDFSQIK